MKKTFKDLVEEIMPQEKELKKEEEIKEELKPQAVLNDSDNLDCLICSVIKALGHTNGRDE